MEFVGKALDIGRAETLAVPAFARAAFSRQPLNPLDMYASSRLMAFGLAGAQGKRFALPHARIMIHQPWGGAEGAAADIHIQAQEILRLRSNLEEILAHHTKQPIERIKKDSDRDYFMSAEEAKAYGIVDEVVKNIAKKK